MTKNSIKKYLETRNTLRRQFESLSTAGKALEAGSGLQKLIKEANRNQDLIRAAFGPIDELRRSGVFDMALQRGAEVQRMQEALENFDKQFRLPEIAEAAKLFSEIENSNLTTIIKRHQAQSSEIRRAMEAMRTPWLNIENKLGSVTGFVELQGIGHAMRTMRAFDTSLTDRLRIDLGDWRKKIKWPDSIFTDPIARTSFYAERGLDPALTAFPASAFEQSVTIAGIKRKPPPLIKAYSYEAEGEIDEEEAGYARTNDAHDRLQRFESQLRKFIDDQMTAAFGDNWIKHQVPGEMRQAWGLKQEKARDNGERKQPLIAFADFTDYEKIISKNNNWEAVFKPVFKRKMLVQEAFQRLYPIRICTMHARIITQDDELYLYVETKLILDAIGIVI